MVTASEVMIDVAATINEAGVPIRIRYFSGSVVVTDYDNVNLLQSGADVYTSGLKQPINNRDLFTSTKEFNFEQGKLRSDDSKIYILGNINMNQTLKIGIGSPSTDQYAIIDGGLKTWNIHGTDVYHKAFIRRLTTGSLANEQ